MVYQSAVQDEARKIIGAPITSHDIEVELLYASIDPKISVDVDNVAKPTLDALKNIAYKDDRQVRAVRVVRFDTTKRMLVSGRIGPINAIFRQGNLDTVWVNIYSRSRLVELGGAREVMKGRSDYSRHVVLDFDPARHNKERILGMYVPAWNRVGRQPRTKREKVRRRRTRRI